MPGWKRIKILIIDDEPLILKSVASYFDDREYEVLSASSGADGLEVFRAELPDVVITDLRMPEVSGFDVVTAIANENPNTPVLVVSGTGSLPDAVEAVRAGAWDFVTKPITDLVILEHAVKRALDRASLLKDNQRYQERLEAEVISRTAELIAANEELARTRLQIVRRLGRASEYKDSETGKHVIRVSYYSKILAEGLGLDTETVNLIFESSLVHDIGKIGIPDSILQKKGELSRQEWEIMKKHCTMGADMLLPARTQKVVMSKKTPFRREFEGNEYDNPLLRMAADIGNYHHERWDGKGYPKGLLGLQIPLSARIVSVADTYDALSNWRPYKPAFTQDVCEKLLRQASGTQLDPNIVEVFFGSIKRILEVKRNWAEHVDSEYQAKHESGCGE